MALAAHDVDSILAGIMSTYLEYAHVGILTCDGYCTKAGPLQLLYILFPQQVKRCNNLYFPSSSATRRGIQSDRVFPAPVAAHPTTSLPAFSASTTLTWNQHGCQWNFCWTRSRISLTVHERVPWAEMKDMGWPTRVQIWKLKKLKWDLSHYVTKGLHQTETILSKRIFSNPRVGL